MNPKEVRELWVQALESGEYKQGQGVLMDQGYYCCLGVLAKLAVEHGIVPGFDGWDADLADDLEPVKAWAGLRTDDGTYHLVDGHHGRSLAADNDSSVSFREIAAIIRAEPKGLLTKDPS